VPSGVDGAETQSGHGSLSLCWKLAGYRRGVPVVAAQLWLGSSGGLYFGEQPVLSD